MFVQAQQVPGGIQVGCPVQAVSTTGNVVQQITGDDVIILIILHQQQSDITHDMYSQ